MCKSHGFPDCEVGDDVAELLQALHAHPRLLQELCGELDRNELDRLRESLQHLQLETLDIDFAEPWHSELLYVPVERPDGHLDLATPCLVREPAGLPVRCHRRNGRMG